MIFVPGLANWRMKPLLDTIPPFRLISILQLAKSKILSRMIQLTIPVQRCAECSCHGYEHNKLVSQDALPNAKVVGLQSHLRGLVLQILNLFFIVEKLNDFIVHFHIIPLRFGWDDVAQVMGFNFMVRHC